MSRGESKAKRRERLVRQAQGLPKSAGAYLFLDGGGRVIYVGKSKSLRSRVRSYFGNPADLAPKVQRTVDSTHEIDFIVTPSEMEALLLEYNLIKEHRPRYNVVYRDDKKYPYIQVTLPETFPRVFPTRKMESDGSRFFGPYTDVGAMRRTLQTLRTVFPLPTCKLNLVPGMSERGCLDYFLGRCVGPCRGDVDPKEYRTIVNDVLRFLDGKKDDVVITLERDMVRAAREMRYEDAAKLRDRLLSLKKTVAKQHVTLKGQSDVDAVGFVRLGRQAIGVLLSVRDGRVIGRDRIEIGCTPAERESEILRGLFLGFYHLHDRVPREILVRTEPGDAPLLREWLGDKVGRQVALRIPRRGVGVRLLEMAEHNAQVALARPETGLEARSRGPKTAVAAVAKALGLAKPPRRIEGFDISTIQGTDTYASMVVFEEGAPAKAEYRTFRIREAPRRDDPRAIEEAVRRRARRIRTAGGRPDLMLIDGGPTQLGAASRALASEALEDLPVVSLAKREELIFFPGRAEPLRLPPDADALKLLQRVRDEAHRFALRAHRRRRGGRVASSVLDEVPGIGPSRRRVLIHRFGSVEAIRKATLSEIAEVPGIGRELALSLWTHLGGAEES
jgi:excinuclease ABC subunit C